MWRYGPGGEETPPNDHDFYTHCQIVPDLQTSFRWGRHDCDTAPYSDDDVELPAATLGYEGLMEFFAEEFGFSPRQVWFQLNTNTIMYLYHVFAQIFAQ